MGRVLVVAGGSRGIGAASAVLAAEGGWDVCVGYRDAVGAAGEVVAACRERGVSAVAVRADVTEEDDVRTLFDTAADELGAPTGLVVSAGIVAPTARLADMTAERVTRMLAVNVLGTLLCARQAVRWMSTAYGGSGGAIVTVSSRASVVGSPGQYIDYAASKAAVDTLTIGLAKEVAEEGVRVNAVRPGLIATDIHADTGDPDRLRRLAPTVPLGRVGRPQEVAEAIVWLLSPAASYVTGAILDVTGGR